MLVVVGVISAAAVGIMELNGQLMTHQRKASSYFQIDLIRRNIAALVLTPASWQATLSGARNNTAVACLRNSTQCTESGNPGGSPIADRPFAIYDGAGALYYDATSTSSGFNLAGQPCDTYSSAGNDQCPFRFDLQWTATCNAGNCINPQVTVKALLVYTPSPGTTARLMINPARYSIEGLYRSAQ
jgi:hypothetical protein